MKLSENQLIELKNDYLTMSNIDLQTKYNKSFDYLRKIVNKLGIKKEQNKNDESIQRLKTDIILEKCYKMNYIFLGYDDGSYKNAFSIFKLKCNIDKYEWKSDYNKFINNDTNCHKCTHQNINNNEEHTKYLNNINNKCSKYNYTFIGFVDKEFLTKSKLIIKCNKDNYTWSPTYHNFINRDQSCKKCKGLFNSEEEVISKILDKCILKDYIFLEFVDNYKNNKSKFKLKCKNNHVWETNYSNFINHPDDRGCPYCMESKGENIINKYLKSYNINYIRQHKFEDCKYKRKLPFDFYLPDYNCCIEFDGIQHYEPVKRFGVDNLLLIQKKDKIKNEYCFNNNIRLIRIKYNEDISSKLTIF